jgi:hypothetical protein
LLVGVPARPRTHRFAVPLTIPDWLPALVNAARAFITISVVEIFWVVTACQAVVSPDRRRKLAAVARVEGRPGLRGPWPPRSVPEASFRGNHQFAALPRWRRSGILRGHRPFLSASRLLIAEPGSRQFSIFTVGSHLHASSRARTR